MLSLRSSHIIVVFLAIGLLAGFLTSQFPPAMLLWGVLTLAVFIVSFMNVEWALYLIIFSMLLSPEITFGETSGGSLGRGVTLRLEDFLLIVIGLSWFCKNAIYKDLGLFLKTPLNKAISFYVLACIVSTGFGIMTGRVGVKTGSLFLLKYIEYFILFFMVVNSVRSSDLLKRFLFCLFLTCFIVSIIGILQIPSGERVSAPFEGQAGEPNTFGGYLLFTGMIAAGLITRVSDAGAKRMLAVLILVIIPPFLFTQSRSSYLALIPACLVLGIMMQRRVIILGLFAISFLMSPLFLPPSVKERILYTFNQAQESGQIQIGTMRLDSSTSARLNSWKKALQDWPKHPLFGYGITGYAFLDAQLPRVLLETGIIGLIAFLYLLYSVFKLALHNIKSLKTPYFKGLSIGFLAGYVGLLFHALGANTFIIVRIMEPLWFFTGMMAVLPKLDHQHETQLR